MKIFILILISALAFLPNIASADGNNRCKVSHCLCKVKPGTPSKVTNTMTQKRRSPIYFSEDSSKVSAAQEDKISAFAENSKPSYGLSITLIGYADGCGSAEYNKKLASDRVGAVKALLRKKAPGARVSVKIIGEQVSGHLPEARRVDMIVHTKNSFATKIEKIPADVYLIDASGSMWDGWKGWQDVINASLKPNSEVYLSIMTGCRNGQYMSEVTPQSGTEIWYSYWKVLEKMKHGETLLIISDFQSNYKLTHGEARLIDQRVKEKGVIVHTLR